MYYKYFYIQSDKPGDKLYNFCSTVVNQSLGIKLFFSKDIKTDK